MHKKMIIINVILILYVLISKLYLIKHIRAKLLIPPSSNELSIGSDGRPLRAIMPPEMKSSQLSLESFISNEENNNNNMNEETIANDFAIDITHIEKMVQDTDSIILDKRPLDGVQSCLKSLRDQMSDLQHEVHEQTRASSQWRYRLGFTCEKCEMKWYYIQYVYY